MLDLKQHGKCHIQSVLGKNGDPKSNLDSGSLPLTEIVGERNTLSDDSGKEKQAHPKYEYSTRQIKDIEKKVRVAY